VTILQALDRYYDRMGARGEADDLGFTRENISYAISLNHDGSVRDIFDMRNTTTSGTVRPIRVSVPRPKRTSNVQANFLWDKTAYAFGVDSGKSKRLDKENHAFKALHREMLSGLDNDHVHALLAFLDAWTPDQFREPLFKPEMLDASFVFRLEDERRYFHDVPELRHIWLSSLNAPAAPTGFCLVSGRYGPLEIGHPIVKGVDNAQTAGAYLVSFNADAYTSYGKSKDATNAPTSTAAAARYGAALNALLDRVSSRNRLRVGDATVVFWADTSGVGEEAAKAAEEEFAAIFDPPPTKGRSDDDAQEAAKLRDRLENFAKGRPVKEIDPRLAPGTRFYVLGLAPNAARLSVRFWLEDSFENIASRLGLHAEDLAIESKPHGWVRPPSIQRLLVKTTALQEKFDNIPPQLAGEVTRSVLTGLPYPRTLLSAVITRLRAGDGPGSGWHAAVIKACINRALRFGFSEHRTRPAASKAAGQSKEGESKEEELPVALEPDKKNAAYQLGRSATPARVFGPLLRGLKHHVSDAKKRGKGRWIESKVGEIMLMLPPDLPKMLRLEDQGRFAVGYYHERATRPAKSDNTETEGEDNGE
jgi:CRISPR-associated protein Csd1